MLDISHGLEIKTNNSINGYKPYLTSQWDKLILLLVYVNDMIIARDDTKEKLALKKRLVAQFEIYFLGIEVAYWKKKGLSPPKASMYFTSLKKQVSWDVK